MSLDLIVAIVEIVGAIGVIVTLIYLAIQVRENTKLQKIESRRFETQSADPFMSPIVSDPHVAKLFLTGLRDPKSLPEEDCLRFSLLFGKFMSANTMVYEEYVGELANQDDLNRRKETVKMFLDTPGGHQFWAMYCHNYPLGFQSWIAESILKK